MLKRYRNGEIRFLFENSIQRCIANHSSAAQTKTEIPVFPAPRFPVLDLKGKISLNGENSVFQRHPQLFDAVKPQIALPSRQCFAVIDSFSVNKNLFSP